MIKIKKEREIEILKEGGLILKKIIEKLRDSVKPGIKTKELDDKAYKMIIENNAKPSFLNYQGYPKSICTSINEEVVHGIPGERALKEGDIVGIDLGVFYKGYHTDAAVTVPVGKISEEDSNLIKETKKSLYRGLNKVKEGNKIGDIASAIQSYVEANNYSVVRDCTGHGIGADLHEDPSVPNYGKAGQGIILKEGMVLAIEPMVNLGSYEIITLEDGWTIVTSDGKKSAHFEFTIKVTKNGYENLTPINI